MRTVVRMQPATDAPRIDTPVPPPPADRRMLAEEILVVLSLSILARVAFAILSLIEAPIAGVVGLEADRPARDVARGALLFVVVGLAGIGVYLAAVELGVNRFVVPTPPLGHWWTVPVLVLNATEAALLEEVVVVAYLVTRLRQLGLTENASVGASALLRGTYHLYQGWGGFLGNLAMGAL